MASASLKLPLPELSGAAVGVLIAGLGAVSLWRAHQLQADADAWTQPDPDRGAVSSAVHSLFDPVVHEVSSELVIVQGLAITAIAVGLVQSGLFAWLAHKAR